MPRMPRTPIVLDESLFIVASNTINIRNGCLTRHKIMPPAPRPHKNGKLAIPLSPGDAWLAYIAAKEIQPRALHSNEQYKSVRVRNYGHDSLHYSTVAEYCTYTSRYIAIVEEQLFCNSISPRSLIIFTSDNCVPSDISPRTPSDHNPFKVISFKRNFCSRYYGSLIRSGAKTDCATALRKLEEEDKQ